MSKKKTYDNLDDLIADITAQKVTEIDFSTFRNIHESLLSSALLSSAFKNWSIVFDIGIDESKNMFLIWTCQKF